MENKRLKDLLAVFESRKDDPFIRYAIALELKEEDLLQQSKEHFTELHSLFPDYVPQYFHFGKLLEQLEEQEQAKEMYVQGIQIAEAARDWHAASEIRGALELLEASMF